MKMENYYQFANVTLKIEHENDPIFSYIDKEISNYRSDKKGYIGIAKINPKTTEIKIPEKAIRTNVFDGQSIYSHNQQAFIVGKNREYSIILNLGKKEIIVDHIEDTDELRKMLRWLLKWIIIISAQENGLVYLHASAGNYKGKNIIFCGDSHCGKSSSLLRLIRNGARAISDDSVLFDGKNLIPFTLNTTIDEDLRNRFRMDSNFNIEKYIDHDLNYGKPDLIIFLKVWNYGKSQFQELDYNKALLNLMQIYKKEIPFVWSILEKDSTKTAGEVFKNYASLLEGVKCYEFFAGSDEEEVRNKLISFLDETGF